MASPLDAATLRRSMELFEEALRRHRDEINSLNVFPVPDGDTGTNLLLTQGAVVAALDATPPVDLSALGAVIARASLLGARGNSGVILSQALRGLCERLGTASPVDGPALAGALAHASREAERAVASPQEGTVLSVLRDAARTATDAAGGGADASAVLRAALDEGRRSLVRTRELLPELRRAHVVDAGGRGIVLLLAALHAAVSGGSPEEPIGPFGPVGGSTVAVGLEAAREEGIEVQFLLEASESAVADLRLRLADVGDSLVVVGGGGLYNVHVHVPDPREAMILARTAGSIRTVRTTPLRDLTGDCIGGRARAVRVAEQVCALVAVASGVGLERAFRSLGALVVSGPDPSDAEIVEAVEAAPAGLVLVLPNHPGVVSSAERAARAGTKEVRVVPTTSVPAGLAAAAAFDPLQPMDVNAEALEAAARGVRAGEVVASDGRWVGLVEGRVAGTGDAPSQVGHALAMALADGGDPELVTVIAGEDAEDGEPEALADRVRSAFPEAEVQIVRGGQPGPRYLIGIE